MIQLQVLNKILQEKDSSLITLNGLNESYFSDYKDEFNYILNHIHRYNIVPDFTTFLNVFPKFTVVEVGERDTYLLSELVTDKNKRELANIFNQVRDLMLEDKIDEAMQVYKDSHEKLSSGIALQSVDILRDTSRYDDYVERVQDFQ